MDVEPVLRQLGKYGIWQIGIYVLWAFSFNVPYVFQALSLVFIASVPPEYQCKVDSNQSMFVHSNITEQYRCHVYTNGSFSNSTESCPNGWIYPDTEYGTTIVSEFDLVCGRNYLAELTQTFFVLGEAIGALLVTPLADLFGRKTIHLISQFFLAVSSVCVAFSVNYVMFICFRILSGIFLSGVAFTALVAALELFPTEMRTFAGQAFYFWWAGSMMILDFLAYFIREWWHLQLTLAILPFASMAGYWLCPESVPWLIANKKVTKAEKIVKRAAKMNKVVLGEHPFEECRKLSGRQQSEIKGDEEEKPQKHGFFSNCKILLKHKLLRRIFLIVMSLWFVNTLVYYGISFMSPTLTNDRYLNFFLTGLAEVPACIVCLATLNRYGRRFPIFIFHVLAAVSLLIMVWLPKKTADGKSLPWLLIALNFIGKFAITGSFNALYQLSMEVYPTNQRNTGLGLSSMTGRISGMIAPFAILLGRLVPWLPYLIFAVLSLIVGVLALFLPETKDYPLPQEVSDMDNWQLPTLKSILTFGKKGNDDVISNEQNEANC